MHSENFFNDVSGTPQTECGLLVLVSASITYFFDKWNENLRDTDFAMEVAASWGTEQFIDLLRKRFDDDSRVRPDLLFPRLLHEMRKKDGGDK